MLSGAAGTSLASAPRAMSKSCSSGRAFRGALCLSLAFVAGCDSGDSPWPRTGGTPGDTYGEERIGYKLQRSTDEATATDAPDGQNAGAADSMAGALLDEEDEESIVEVSEETGGTEFTDEFEPPEHTDVELASAASNDAGAGDAGVVDAGTGNSGADDAGLMSLPTLDGGSSSDAGIDAGTVSAADDRLDDMPGLQCDIPDFDDIPETERLEENPFRVAKEMPASTFSIDVDTGAYTLARKAINEGTLPARDRVRIEEFINYFHLHYAQPDGDVPFAVYTELSDCPWNPDNQLMMVGIQGQEVVLDAQPAANLVYLLDVSGSMNAPGKLPLLKQGFRMMTRQLRPQDRVSIVTYAGDDRVVLQGVRGDDKATIMSAIDNLDAAGSTNGEGGIQRAYELATEHFIEGGNNRILLATDGDFNVGVSGAEALTEFIADKRDSGVFLSVYGFGSPNDNFQDEAMEQLADNGNGIYFFIDSPEEARRAFVHTITGSLVTVAKDVKLQLQFNPSHVKGYRLIGYENRVLSNAAFDDDSVDAGELGAGLSVTAFFELIPTGTSATVPQPAPGTDPLRDEDTERAELEPVAGAHLVDVRIRYKGDDAEQSKLLSHPYTEDELATGKPSLKFLFASAVAEFAMQLRGSQYLVRRRTLELLDQISLAFPADTEGAVEELYELAELAYEL